MELVRISPCNLCPRMCGALRTKGERGACGADARMFVARAALHFWEEPPISGEAGSGTVFFSRCPLRCVYCQNREIAGADVGREMDAGSLADTCLELQVQGALNVNFVTPTHQSLGIRDAVALARERGLKVPVVWNTSGYERVETVRVLDGMVDVYLVDFKYADTELAERYSHARDYPQVALDAIGTMLDQVGECEFDEVDGRPRMTRGVVVRHLLLPGASDNSRRALELLWSRFGDAVAYSIMNQYTPVAPSDVVSRCPELASRVPLAEYEALLDFADALGLEDYYWQDRPAAEESFIPAWDVE